MGAVLRYFSLLLIIACPQVGGAQSVPVSEEVPQSIEHLRALADPEAGRSFYFEHFTPREYGRYPQNWSITQDSRGIIYVANADGILQYDGVSWRLIRTVNNTIVRSLAVDREGVVYAGVVGDFGYLAPDSVGLLRYVSLLEEISPEDRDFQDVWSTKASSDGVFFQTPGRLFRWDGNEMHVWHSEEEQRFHTSFVVNDKFYVRQIGVGLLKADGDSLQLVSDGHRFAETRIYMMAPYDQDHILIATREQGFYLFDGESFDVFETEADDLLEDFRLYHGTQVSDELYVLATLDGGGAVVIDKGGRLIQRINEPVGILDDWINYVHPDEEGGLWMALNNKGIVRLDAFSPLTVYTSEEAGLTGIINDVQRYGRKLYVASQSGLFVLDEREDSSTFKRIEEVKTAWSLYATDSLMFIGSSEGLYVLGDEETGEVTLWDDQLDVDLPTVFRVQASQYLEGMVLLGTKRGLAFLKSLPSQGWSIREDLGAIKKEIRWLTEGEDGTFWAASLDGQLFNLRIPDAEVSPVSSTGLPQGQIKLDRVGSDIGFVTPRGIFRLGREGNVDVSSSGFYRDETLLSSEAALADSVYALHVDPSERVWIAYSDHIEIATPQSDGSYDFEIPDELRFPKHQAVQLFVEEDGIAWIGNGDQLIRYDPRISKSYDKPFSALVRTVASPITGQVFYAGSSGPEAPALQLGYENNDLRFEVAATSYNDPSANRYQYFLEGADNDWSGWTRDNSRSYRDLWEGRYVLHVRARNGQGYVSEEATYAFRIMPPLYRTWWAYSLYFLGFLGFLALSRHYYAVKQENKRAREQARELEQERIARERLRQANERLRQANESLTQVNQLKDEFLANTSHELRTPLTAILGFSSVLKEELPKDFLELLDPIESNGQRLLRTVNSLLDIAKLRAGMMEVRKKKIDVIAQAAEIVRSLSPLAQQKKLQLDLSCPPDPVYAHIDERYLERILDNLIGNAIKFTDEGAVSVSVERAGDRVLVHVADTGIGIDRAFIPHIFDEFKQESTGLARSYEGSGLGLAITARLVRLLDGEIKVESEKGRGSVFTVSLPVAVAVTDERSPRKDQLPSNGSSSETPTSAVHPRPSPAV